MLSEQTVGVIQAITPLVAEHAETITRRFYQRMFAGNPEVQAFFNPAHQRSGQQPRALAHAVSAYFANIDNPAVLAPAIEIIAQKHCSLGIQPEHYPIVGEHLLGAVKEVMGEGATEEVMTAVADAYQVLAQICIDREAEIYAQQKQVAGGWNGFRPFVVERKVAECPVVTSFYLKPQDGGELPKFLPGQYITVRCPGADAGVAPRNYSLSDIPEVGHFRISVKREVGPDSAAPDGVVSNLLHQQVNEGDVLEVGPPCGEFTLDPETVTDRPVAFLAGGIGITPLLSMARTLVDYGVLAPIQFIHAVKNADSHPFRDEVQMMVSDKDFVDTRVLYDEPQPGDLEAGHCDHVGRLDTQILREWTNHAEADFYVCGPPAFMSSVTRGLAELGVPASRVHLEFFGPQQELANAGA